MHSRGKCFGMNCSAPNPGAADDYQIGCILLESPFFFDRADWVPLPNWKREIVRGRGYDSEGDGREISHRGLRTSNSQTLDTGEAIASCCPPPAPTCLPAAFSISPVVWPEDFESVSARLEESG